MQKLFVVLTLALLAAFGAVFAPAANAQGTNPDVSKITPFTQQANYMSLPGYLRFRVLIEQGRWISHAEAVQAVQSEGAPTGPAPAP